LPAALPIVLPAGAFALAATGPSFVFVSMSAQLNRYVLLEAQQAMLFVLWLYVGAAFLLRARSAGAYVVPLVEFAEGD